MKRLTDIPHNDFALRKRAVALRSEIQSTRERARRISAALELKQRSLTRLEALIALSGDAAGAGTHDE